MLGKTRATAVCWKPASINEQWEQVNTPVDAFKRPLEAGSHCWLGKAPCKAEPPVAAGRGYNSQQVS